MECTSVCVSNCVVGHRPAWRSKARGAHDHLDRTRQLRRNVRSSPRRRRSSWPAETGIVVDARSGAAPRLMRPLSCELPPIARRGRNDVTSCVRRKTQRVRSALGRCLDAWNPPEGGSLAVETMTAATNVLLRLLQRLREAAARRRAMPRGTSEYEAALREERQVRREVFRAAGGTPVSSEEGEQSTGRREGVINLRDTPGVRPRKPDCRRDTRTRS
jgi:hypothetical protein